jgi:hypothetical protein
MTEYLTTEYKIIIDDITKHFPRVHLMPNILTYLDQANAYWKGLNDQQIPVLYEDPHWPAVMCVTERLYTDTS